MVIAEIKDWLEPINYKTLFWQNIFCISSFVNQPNYQFSKILFIFCVLSKFSVSIADMLTLF